MTVTAHPQRSGITIASADRYELARLGMAQLTRRYPDLRLAAEAATLAEVPAMLARTRPAVVVIGDDLFPGGAPAVDVAELRAAHPAAGIVVVSHRTDDARFDRFREAGVSAFVSRSAPATAVLAAVRHAAAAPDQFRTFGVPWNVEWEANRAPSLSQRERQVLELLKDGLPAADIAASLRVGEGTVRTYVSRLYAKLGVSNRSQALVAAAAPVNDAPSPATPRSGR